MTHSIQETLVNNVTAELPNSSDIAQKMSTHPTLLIAIAGFTIQYLTKKERGEPFTNSPGLFNRINAAAHAAVRKPKIDVYKDKRRHGDLCRFRGILNKKLNTIIDGCEDKTLYKKDNYPSHWKLEDDRPTYRISFQDNADIARENEAKLDASHYPQRKLVADLVAIIGDLFESLSKRWSIPIKRTETWQIYRPDGFEVMFFSDIGIWFSQTLPYYDVKRPETAQLVEAWILYCKEVQDHVIFSRDPADYPYRGPSGVLKEVITRLERLYKNLCVVNESLSFNDRLSNIHSDFDNTISSLFNIFHLTQQQDPNMDQFDIKRFSVTAYLAHSQSFSKPLKKIIDPRTQLFAKQTRLAHSDLGRSVVGTLNKMGIEWDDYIHEESEINLAFIEEYELCSMPSNGIFKKDKLYIHTHENALHYTVRDIAQDNSIQYTICLKKQKIPLFLRQNAQEQKKTVYQKGTLYIEICSDSFKYTILDPAKKPQDGEIRFDELNDAFTTPITIEQLQKCLSEIIDIISIKGHTPAIPTKKGVIPFNLLDESLETPVTFAQLEPYLSKILDITTIRGHTPAEKHLPFSFDDELYTTKEITDYLNRSGLLHFLFDAPDRDNARDIYKKAFSSLKKIMELHRLLQKFCYVQNSITLSSKVVTDWGKLWLYGGSTGREVARKLLNSIEFSSEMISSELNAFWADFLIDYTNRFGDLENTTEIGCQLIMTQKHVNIIEKSIASIKSEVKIIRETMKKPIDYDASANDLVNLDYNLDNYLYLSHPEYKDKPPIRKDKSKFVYFGENGLYPEFNSEKENIPTESVKKKKINTRDENCFFHAVEAELSRLKLENYSFTELRKKAIDQLNVQKLDGSLLECFDENIERMDDYIERMSHDRAEGPILKALAIALNVEICVLDRTTDDVRTNESVIHINHIEEEAPRGVLCLIYESNHYFVHEIHTVDSEVSSEDGIEKDDEESIAVSSDRAAAVETEIIPENRKSELDKVINEKQLIVVDGDNLPFFKKILSIFLSEEISDSELNKPQNYNVKIRKPSDFYSGFQKTLYVDFFEHKLYGKDIIKWYLFACVNTSWWFLPKDKIKPYLTFFQRFKHAMDTLFIENKDSLTLDEVNKMMKPSEHELKLIELFFSLMFIQEFNKHQYYNHPVQAKTIGDVDTVVIRNETEIEFIFDTFMLKMNRDKDADGFAYLIQGEHGEIEKLNAVIANQAQALLDKTAEAEKYKTKLTETETKLTETETALKYQQNATETLQRDFDSFKLNQRLEKLENKKKAKNLHGKNPNIIFSDESTHATSQKQDKNECDLLAGKHDDLLTPKQ